MRSWIVHGRPGPEEYLGGHDPSGRVGKPMLPRCRVHTFMAAMTHYAQYLLETGREVGTASEFCSRRAKRLGSQQTRIYLATKKQQPVVYEADFLRAIRAVQCSYGKHARSVEAVLYLAYYCGLRVRDITFLRWGDVDLVFGIIVIESPKYSRPYRVFMPRRLQRTLADLKALYHDEPLATDYVFPARDGGPHATTTLWRWLNRLGFSPHALRRGCATHLIRSGVPIEMVAKIMNHSNVSTTLGYVYYTDAEMRDAVERAVL